MLMRWSFALVLMVCVGKVVADDIRPAYLQLTEISPTAIQVLWKVPARGQNQRLSLAVSFGSDTEQATKATGGFVGSAHLQRWIVRRSDGVQGMAIEINGLSQTSTEVLMRFQYQNGSASVHPLTPDSPSYTVDALPSLLDVVYTYFVLGVEHILMGVDHLLFVLVLLMLVNNVRKLVWTITAFTLAHSITLSLASLDVIRIPVPPVEACIALSIVFVAVEIIRAERSAPGLAARWPWVVAFTFGLLHGLGFAAALEEIGLPQSDIVVALLFFNLGVEAGQLWFVAMLLGLIWMIKVSGVSLPKLASRLALYLIGSVAAFWTIERTVGFWS